MLIFRHPRWSAALLALALVLVSGCAQVATAPTSSAATTPAPAVTATPASSTPVSDGAGFSEDLLPLTDPPTAPEALEQDPLYQALSAEFAGQREALPFAVQQYSALAAGTKDPAIAERATRIAVFAEDPAAAVLAAERWVSLAPDDLEARQIAAALHVRQGEAEPAIVHLEYFLDHDRSPDEVKLRTIANLLGREEDKATALKVMERLVESRVSEADTLLMYAVLALRAEDLQAAQRAMDRLVAKADVKPAIALAYVDALQRQGRREEALAFLERALARTPTEYGLRLLKARLLGELKRYEEAREEFLVLDREAPGTEDVVFALGLLAIETRRYEEAATRFEALAEFEARAIDAQFYLGQVAEMRGNPTAARRAYEKVTEGEYQFAAGLRMAALLAAEGRTADAQAVVQALRPANEDEARQALLARTELLIGSGDLAAAMALFDEALNTGDDPALRYSRAMLAERMDNLDLLETDLKAVLKAQPDNAEALNALGYTLADRGLRLDEARGYIARALELSPDSFYVLDSMGWVLFRMGKAEEAIPYLEKARTLRNDAEVAAHLGEVLWSLGRRDEARAIWDAALKEAPEDPRLMKTLKRFPQ